MSQTAITTAFEQWKARQSMSNEAIALDEFVFALVPGLDVSAPVDRAETLPPVAQIVHRQAVSRTGVVNENAVVFSVVLGADTGDFSFNWIGLVNRASNTLAMVVHAPEQQKFKTAAGQQGNVLTRSFLLEFNGAQKETAINTPAETWQIDFTARMGGMDERQRLENMDIYGAAAFFGDGWLVGKNGAQYFVTQGAGYVGGLRAQLAASMNIAVTALPVKVWLDVCWKGTLTSVWQVESTVTVAAELADYVKDGVQHYVFALASIDASGTVTDLRPKGTLNEQNASDALKKHEQSRNHPDATTSAKGFTQLSSATDSDSEVLAATPKAVRAANDNANSRVPLTRKVNGRELSADISVTAQDIFNGQAVAIGNAADLNTFMTPGLYYQNTNDFAAAGANYPEANAGSLEVYKHAGITQIYRIYNNSRSYIRTYWSGVWSAWSMQYDAVNRPTAENVDAVSASQGGTFSKMVQFDGGVTVGGYRNGIFSGADNAGFGSNNMMLQSWYGIGFYCTLTDGVIPEVGTTGYINTRTGRLEMKEQIIPGNYANFDARYHTQASANARFVAGVRLGASSAIQERGNNERITGGVMTSWADMGSSNYWIRLRPLQYLINGAWVTAAYA